MQFIVRRVGKGKKREILFISDTAVPYRDRPSLQHNMLVTLESWSPVGCARLDRVQGENVLEHLLYLKKSHNLYF